MASEETLLQGMLPSDTALWSKAVKLPIEHLVLDPESLFAMVAAGKMVRAYREGEDHAT